MEVEMKKSYLLLICLLLLPSVFADVGLKSVKVYVNDERYENADKGGGDIFLYQNDILDVVVGVRNDMNKSTNAWIKGTIMDIDDGDDLIKEQKKFDIEPGEERSKSLSFHIPSDANIDRYDFLLEVYYNTYNGTEDKIKVEYDIKILKKEKENEINLVESFNNLTKSCDGIVGSLNTCFNFKGRYENCSSELSTVKEERGTYKLDSENCKMDLEDCRLEKTSIEDKINKCENQKKAMLENSECERRIDVSVKKAEKDKDNFFMGVMAVALAGWFIWKQKKSKISVTDSYYKQKSI